MNSLQLFYNNGSTGMVHEEYRESSLNLWLTSRHKGTLVMTVAALYIGTYQGITGNHVFDVSTDRDIYCGTVDDQG